MNPYLNSMNGFGGGFIAFFPSQGDIGGGGKGKAHDQALHRKRLLREDEELITIVTGIVTSGVLQ